VGRKRRKKFIQSYAKTASKFGIVCDDYARKVSRAAEKLYYALEKNGALDIIDDTDALACAIFLTSGIKEIKESAEKTALMFGADLVKVQEILSAALGKEKENEYEAH
jgi:hypothetical protein